MKIYMSYSTPIADVVYRNLTVSSQLSADAFNPKNITLEDSTLTEGNIYKLNDRFITNPGIRNTFIGVNSGNFSIAGRNNTVIGEEAGEVLNGTGNVIIGALTANELIVGSGNVAIGVSFSHVTDAQSTIEIGPGNSLPASGMNGDIFIGGQNTVSGNCTASYLLGATNSMNSNSNGALILGAGHDLNCTTITAANYIGGASNINFNGTMSYSSIIGSTNSINASIGSSNVMDRSNILGNYNNITIESSSDSFSLNNIFGNNNTIQGGNGDNEQIDNISLFGNANTLQGAGISSNISDSLILGDNNSITCTGNNFYLQNMINIGYNNESVQTAATDNSICIGVSNNFVGNKNICIGENNGIEGNSNICMGIIELPNNFVSGNSNICVGHDNNISSNNSVIVGEENGVSPGFIGGDTNYIFGFSNGSGNTGKLDGSVNVIVGGGNGSEGTEIFGDNNLIFGFQNNVSNDPSKASSNVIIGNTNDIKGNTNNIYGKNNSIISNSNFIIGNSNIITDLNTHSNNVILGNSNTIECSNSIIIGNSKTLSSDNNIIIGDTNTVEIDLEATNINIGSTRSANINLGNGGASDAYNINIGNSGTGIITLGNGGTSDINYDIFFGSSLPALNNPAPLYFDGNTLQIGSGVSSRKYKEDIVDIEDEYLNKIFQLNAKKFKYKGSENQSFGLIAEEVYEVMPELVGYRNGEIDFVHYQHLTPMFIEIIKKLNQRITFLENKFIKKK